MSRNPRTVWLCILVHDRIGPIIDFYLVCDLVRVPIGLCPWIPGIVLVLINNGHFGVEKRSFWWWTNGHFGEELTVIFVTVNLVENIGHFGRTAVILENIGHFGNHPVKVDGPKIYYFSTKITHLKIYIFKQYSETVLITWFHNFNKSRDHRNFK